MDTPKNVKEVVLWAWIGEDEFGSDEVGLKQGVCPAGVIPLVACKEGKIDQDYLKQQMQKQANHYGKNIRLCKFVFAEEIETVTPNSDKTSEEFPIVDVGTPCPRCQGHERLMQRCAVCAGTGKTRKK